MIVNLWLNRWEEEWGRAESRSWEEERERARFNPNHPTQ